MKNCDFEKYLFFYLTNELNPNEYIEVENHLKSCSFCSRQLDDYIQLHKLLSNKKREKAPHAIYQSYRARLKSLFPIPSIWNILNEIKISVRIPRVPVVRIARAFALLIVGIFIGRFLFVTNNNSRQIALQENTAQQMSVLSQADIQFLNNYFIQSELLLLAIENSSSPVLDENDLSLNRELAKNLLFRSNQVQRKIVQLEDKSLEDFLNHMELLLLDLSNRNADEISAIFDDIKDRIEEADMVKTSRRLQQQLKKTEPKSV